MASMLTTEFQETVDRRVLDRWEAFVDMECDSGSAMQKARQRH